MKVLLTGKNSQDIENLLKSLGFEMVKSNPDVIISFGGDGTLLSAEREYPGVPKLPIRNSQFCHKCAEHADEHLFSQLLQNKLQIKEYKKLHTKTVDRKELFALNDFVIRNEHPMHVIRFQANDGPLLIGDGIIVSTPFGSSGYFKSVTGKTFEEGFGIAFNNITQNLEPLFLKHEDFLTFKLVRGKATLSFDNSPDIFNIDEESELVFKLSNQVAKIYSDTSLRCPNCQVIRG
ncbi:hypothetical protein A3B45_01510 [Candidatus Daviesbacteria bacterium RIFCSPLOWO2_01_FULL_39_12]|uniref:NAD(+) kinase n=1 Tax=Candidatus Daviesbacteria bacterium RIFCSPLOWO2_01_FULL_39_12 TaxID=1797785 RepID=A0A1F5KQI1_9BACT|nr:MAG: hypothetical protein A3B45_01510 [Candidatus Daviesbacteria bacterium RIFCSPLOWO2_01_FULL_39_12]